MQSFPSCPIYSARFIGFFTGLESLATALSQLQARRENSHPIMRMLTCKQCTAGIFWRLDRLEVETLY